MALNINLFVHGVPMGQKIWGPKGEDERYLSSFYGPKWDTPDAMKVDVMTFGGTSYCYYSYIRGNNVCDSQGRTGSYFALTLRINAFYADVQNMYNILKAAYDKMCVGLCVQETNNTIKFLLSDFNTVDSKLKDIECHLLKYISEFSVNNDIHDLSRFSSNSQTSAQNVNLHECNKMVAIDIVKKTGKLMVSPWFMSANAAKTVAGYKAEMQATVQKAQQEIKLQQQTSQREVAEITKKSKEELNTVREQSLKTLKDTEDRYKQQLAKANEESEKKIATLKESYADVDSKIDALEKEIKAKDRSISELNKQCQKKDKEIKGRDSQIQKLYQDKTRLQNQMMSAPIDGEDSLGMMPEPKRINWKIVSAVSFFTLLLIALLTYYAMSNVSKQKQIKTLKMEKVTLANRVDSLQSVIESYASSSEILEIDSNNVEIVVTGIEHDQDQDVLYIGQSYPISIKVKGRKAIYVKNGYWKSEGESLFIENNKSIMPDPQFAGKICKLSFYIDGKVVKTKELLVKKKAQNEN